MIKRRQNQGSVESLSLIDAISSRWLSLAYITKEMHYNIAKNIIATAVPMPAQFGFMKTSSSVNNDFIYALNVICFQFLDMGPSNVGL